MLRRGTIGNKFWVMAQPSLHQGQHWAIVLLAALGWGGGQFHSIFYILVPFLYLKLVQLLDHYILSISFLLALQPGPTYPGNPKKFFTWQVLDLTFRQVVAHLGSTVQHTQVLNCRITWTFTVRTGIGKRMHCNKCSLGYSHHCNGYAWLGVGLNTLDCWWYQSATNASLGPHSHYHPQTPAPSHQDLWPWCWSCWPGWWHKESQQRVWYGGVWLMCGRMAKPHKVCLPITADPRKVTLITDITITIFSTQTGFLTLLEPGAT